MAAEPPPAAPRAVLFDWRATPGDPRDAMCRAVDEAPPRPDAPGLRGGGAGGKVPPAGGFPGPPRFSGSRWPVPAAGGAAAAPGLSGARAGAAGGGESRPGRGGGAWIPRHRRGVAIGAGFCATIRAVRCEACSRGGRWGLG